MDSASQPTVTWVTRLAGQAASNGAFFVVQFLSRVLLTLALGRGLPPEQYGIYALITTTLNLVGSALQLGAHQYYLREAPGRTTEEALTLFKSIVGIQTGFIVGCAAVALLAPGLAARVLEWPALQSRRDLLALVAGLLVADVGVTELARYLIARTAIVRSNLVGFFQQAGWALAVFVWFLAAPGALTLTGVLAVWLGSVLVAGMVGLWFVGLRPLWRAPIRAHLYPAAVRFGLPLMLTTVSSLAIGWSSRYFIGLAYSTHEVGVYAYQYGLITMIAAVSAPLVSSVLDPYMVAAHNRGDTTRSTQLLSASVRYRLLLVLPLLIVAAICSHPLIATLARPDYLGPRWLMAGLLPVPILLILGNAFERVLFLERKTVAIGVCYVAAAAVTLALNAVLIPLQPYYGAAAATDLALLALVVSLWWVGRSSVVRLRVGWRRLASAASVAGLAAAWLSSLLPQDGRGWVLAAVGGAVVLLYGLAAWACRVLSPAEGQLIAQLIAQARRHLAAVAGVSR